MYNDDLEHQLKETFEHEAALHRDRLEGLESRISEELEGRLPKPGFGDLIRDLVAPSKAGRMGQLVVLAATAAVFLIVGGLFLPELSPQLNPAERLAEAGGGVAFGTTVFLVPAPNASEVVLVGSFNNWEATPLADEDLDGIWRVELTLDPGRYEYAFVVDGQWWGQDPAADETVRSYGGYSSVRYIGLAGGDA
ncbi:glycogen-binding domain-containing protein [Candidatus Bipolaricaulota bacterium]|nr:glycogen-binding domain-containing protein [Candidatus Bipolaricaulota bacterium]